MLNDYEKLRLRQLRFLQEWNKSFVKPARERGNNHFSISYGDIYALRIDDLVYFAKENKMEFEYEVYMDCIIFTDIKYNVLGKPYESVKKA